MSFPNTSNQSMRRFASKAVATVVFACLLSFARSAKGISLFNDVGNQDPFAEHIYTLKERGVINGYDDNTYQPNNYVNRGELARFIKQGLNVQAPGGWQKQFDDVRTSHKFYDDIMGLRAAGVINGFDDNTYRPDEYVTRGQLAKFIVNAADLDNLYLPSQGFSDVHISHVFYEEIMTLKAHNIISGYDDGTFRPDEPVNRGELSKFIVEAGLVADGFRDPQASLIFWDYTPDNRTVIFGGAIDKIPGFDHIGFSFNGEVYESTPGLTEGLYWDPEAQIYVRTEKEYGVQRQQTRGAFKHRSTDQNANTRNVQELNIDHHLARGMADAIENQLGARYSDIDISNLEEILDFDYDPFYQKGGTGAFTCVGLIEWAAEQVGHNGGQGFIKNDLEYLKIPGWGQIDVITPNLLYNAITNPEKFNKGGLHGLFDPVDFILTDPLGRRLGYTEEVGLLDEIEDAFYTGDGWAEQFFVSGLIPGDYTLELFGLDDEAKVAFGNSTDGAYFSGYLARGETHTLTFTVPGKSPSQSVPEPGSVFGLLAFGALGTVSMLKRKPNLN